MNTKQIVTGVVALVVAIVITVACAIPVISDSTQTEDTYTNEGYFFINEHNPTDEDVTISWDHTKPFVISVNDNEVSMANVPNNRTVSVQMGPEMVLRYVHTSTTADIRVTGPASYICNTTNGYDMDVVLTSSGATVSTTNGPASATYDYEGTMYYIDTTGPYIMKDAGKPAYIHGDTDLFIVGATAMFGQPVILRIEGNLNDGFQATTIKVGSDAFTVTYGPITAHTTVVSGHNDLYLLDKLTFTVTNDDTSATYDATYNYFMVPYEVTAERTIHPDSTLSTIINVIPVLLIVSIIIGAIALFISNRRD